ncbi:hypothetical protein CAPTEDRAFT_38360, partial [Capitella teleta]|uniref:Uncharacterized protein n=1 Tax=Capitella teleta TaxID=283909 RepID=X2B3F4_CAPTE
DGCSFDTIFCGICHSGFHLLCCCGLIDGSGTSGSVMLSCVSRCRYIWIWCCSFTSFDGRSFDVIFCGIRHCEIHLLNC